jgi:uncharacterized protein YjiS (DUF1127 family)
MYIDSHSRPTGHALHDLALSLAEGIARVRRRRKFKRLLDLDDHMLDDIGVTRSEVDYAARLPLSTDAATELRRISLARRRSKM